MRTATIDRHTTETRIHCQLCLDGTGSVQVRTGVGLLDHFLSLLAFWARFDVQLTCEGDTHIDAHHSVEDVALCLGQCLREAAGDRRGIARVGNARVPMDEALADVCVDLSGRPWLEWRGAELLPPVMAGEESDVWREFYKAFSSAALCNVHINLVYGKNGHHLLESVAKGLGLALAQALTQNGERLPSTKGSLDI